MYTAVCKRPLSKKLKTLINNHYKMTCMNVYGSSRWYKKVLCGQRWNTRVWKINLFSCFQIDWLSIIPSLSLSLCLKLRATPSHKSTQILIDSYLICTHFPHSDNCSYKNLHTQTSARFKDTADSSKFCTNFCLIVKLWGSTLDDTLYINIQ